MQKGKDGLYSGVVYANGKILRHARFDRVSPELAQIATALGTQVLLLNIAVQLNRVEQAIVSISEDLRK